jgi:hypothetical protein
MALQYLTDINLNKNELQNAVIQNLATAPGTPAEGQIYYDSTAGDKQLYFYNGSNWIPVSGDITEVTAGAGLTGGGNSGAVTLDIGAGTGITVNANDIAITNTGVTAASYGSSTAIPVITVNAQGQITAASTAAISTDLTIAADSGTNDVVSIGTDTLTFAGTANEVETTVTNNQIQIGLPDDVTIGNDLTVLGDLQVTGTTTTNNVETVSTSNGVIFEGNTADDNEVTLLAATVTADRTATLPDKTGTLAMLDDINGRSVVATIDVSDTNFISNKYAEITHNLSTEDVIVELFDSSTKETVYADVKRTDKANAASTSKVKILFSIVPTNDIEVIITSAASASSGTVAYS